MEPELHPALAAVATRYPEIAHRIARSLEVPQIGLYHCEGPTQVSHFNLLYEIARQVAGGFVDNTSILRKSWEECIIILNVRGQNAKAIDFEPSNDVIDYIMLHDLLKPNAMNVKLERHPEYRRPFSWRDWESARAAGEPYTFKGSLITNIAYFLPKPNKKGLVNHGELAADYLNEKISNGLLKNLSPRVVKVIAMHDKFFNRNDFITIDHFENLFADYQMDEYDIQFFIAMSYLDLMASLGPDQKPNLEPLSRLLAVYQPPSAF